MKKNQKTKLRLSRLSQKAMVLAVIMAVGTQTMRASVAIDEAHFPDAAFRGYLSEQWDADKDGTLSDSELVRIKSVDVEGNGISSLEGIEYLTSMTTLYCGWNQLTSLDVSANPALTDLQCDKNQLTSLDVSKNTALKKLVCFSNQLTSLDVSKNTALTTLKCQYNQLTSLDVSANTALETLWCFDNQLTSLDVSENKSLTNLSCYKNQRTVPSTYNVKGKKDCYLSIGNDASNPLYVDGFRFEKASSWSNAEVVTLLGKTMLHILDGSKKVTYTYDVGYTGSVDKTFTLNINTGDVGSEVVINEFTFPDATFRGFVMKLAGAEDGVFTDEEIEAIEKIYVYGGIKDLSGIEYFTSLKRLECNSLLNLTSLDLSMNTELTYLDCQKCALTSLNVSHCTALESLICNNNALTSLDVSNCAALVYLNCSMNNLTSLDLENCPNIQTLNPYGNKQTVKPNYKDLVTGSYYLAIDNDATNPLYADGFRIEKASNWEYATVQEIDGKKMLCIPNASEKVTYTYDTGYSGKEVTFELNVDSEDVAELLEINDVNFPDAGFRAYLKNIESGKDGSFTKVELKAVKELNVEGKTISSLKGIELFTELENLYANGVGLTSIDVSKLPNMKKLQIGQNQLTSVDVSGNEALEELDCSNNSLTSIDLSANTALISLKCGGNQLTSLDLSANTAMTTLECAGNQRTVTATFKEKGAGKYYIAINNDASNPLYGDGFRLENASGWSNAAIEEIGGQQKLEIEDASEAVTYTYNTGMAGNDVTFALNIDSNDVAEVVRISEVNFPDVNFRTYLKDLLKQRTPENEELFTQNDLSRITNIECTNMGIESLEGLENFTSMTYLKCNRNKLTSLDLSANTALEKLNCSDNSLTSIDLSANTALTSTEMWRQYRNIEVNYKYEEGENTYYYINLATDEREGMSSGDELSNKLGAGFNLENVHSWNDATVGKTPYGKTDALILNGKPSRIDYYYKTHVNPVSRAIDYTMGVGLFLNYDNVTTIVGEIGSDRALRIYSIAGEICIEGEEAEARVYDTTGQCVYAGTDSKIAMPSGLYIVKVGEVTKKVAVK